MTEEVYYIKLYNHWKEIPRLIIKNEDEINKKNKKNNEEDYIKIKISSIDMAVLFYGVYNNEVSLIKEIKIETKYEDAENIMKKIFSQERNKLPFIKTGYEDFYKETGYFPEISKKIETMEKIEYSYIKSNFDYSFILIIGDGCICNDIVIHPE